MNYEETIAWLYGQLPMFQRKGPAQYRIDLSRTVSLCKALGHPERQFPSIHVAGTNGKGSVCHAVSAALQAGAQSGLKVGLHTSPHMWDPRERIRIDGRMISELRLVNFVAEHQKLWAELKPSFFELMFALAMVVFSEEQVDVAVIETGMGGRLDSTNVVRPVVTAITSIGLDHEQFLGSDLRSIAAEKAGILKDGVPCVVGIMPPEARSVILEHSLRCGVEIHDPVAASPSESEPKWIAQTRGISLKILELLSEETRMLSGLDFKASRARAVLAGTPSDWGLRGRWEWVGPPDTAAQPWALVDCAHNADGLRASLQKLRELGRPLRIVFASVVDKNLSAALELLPTEAKYHFCAADLPRALDPSRLAAQASTFGLVGTAHPATLKKTSVESAVESASNARTGDELLVVLGSIFIAGPALEALGAS